jgi:hypothetical protein
MPRENNGRQNERGAALITAVLISFLLLTLATALVLTTSMSTTNAISSTEEVQAYYAAEAGMQAAVNVLRGNVAPHPDDGTKMNFTNAISVTTSNNPSTGVAQLSRWLVYNYGSPSPDRVTLSPGYTQDTGMAFSVTGVNDPDNSTKVIYNTAGAFDAGTLTTSTSTKSSFSGTSAGTVVLTYTPQPSTDITVTGSPLLGTLQFTGMKGGTSIDFSQAANTTKISIQITETSPLPIGGNTPVSVVVTGTLRGIVSGLTSTVYVDFISSSIEIPAVGTTFTPTLTANGTPTVYSFTLPADSAAHAIPTVVTPAEPGRIVVKVKGYGPHGANKNLQAMLARFGINFDPPATFVIRGHDDLTTASTIDIGNSAQFIYSGYDNSQLGQPLPAFLVTNNPDYTTLTNLKTNNNLPVTGDPTQPIRLVTLPGQVAMLPPFLQTTTDPVTGARAFVQQLRQASQSVFFGCSAGQDYTCDRYFNTRAGDALPTDFGLSQTDGLLTFIDGDVTLPNTGGRGLLVVTGTLTFDGNTPWQGLVLVLGDGIINRSGGGNGISLGAFVLARFGSVGNFLNPSFTSSGSGTSTIQLDRQRVKKALKFGGISVMSLSEF